MIGGGSKRWLWEEMYKGMIGIATICNGGDDVVGVLGVGQDLAKWYFGKAGLGIR